MNIYPFYQILMPFKAHSQQVSSSLHNNFVICHPTTTPPSSQNTFLLSLLMIQCVWASPNHSKIHNHSHTTKRPVLKWALVCSLCKTQPEERQNGFHQAKGSEKDKFHTQILTRSTPTPSPAKSADAAQH